MSEASIPSNERCPHGISLTANPPCHFCEHDRLSAALKWLLGWHNSPYDIANSRYGGRGYAPEAVCSTIDSLCAAIGKPELRDQTSSSGTAPTVRDGGQAEAGHLTDETRAPLSKAHAKRILQDWIDDEAHAESLNHWPDLRAAYEALRAVADSPVETEREPEPEDPQSYIGSTVGGPVTLSPDGTQLGRWKPLDIHADDSPEKALAPQVCGKQVVNGPGLGTCQNPPDHEGDCDDMPF